MIRVTVTGRTASATSDEPITTGSVGIPVAFELSEDFAELAAVATFACGPRRADVALVGNPVTVPAQLLRHGGHRLSVGVLGAAPDGTVVIPTIWADVGVVRPGAEPSGVDPTAPTPSWAAQVQEAAASAVDAATSVSEAAARGDFDGFTPTATVERTEGGATIAITDKDGTTTAEVFDGHGGDDNLTPFFSHGAPAGGANSDDYWQWYYPSIVECVGDGWARVAWRSDSVPSQGQYQSFELCAPRAVKGIRTGGRYTLLVEVRNLSCEQVAEGEDLSDLWPKISVGRASAASYNSVQIGVSESAQWDVTEDGEIRISLVSFASSSKTRLVNISAVLPFGKDTSFDLRLSLYDGDYIWPYKPCPWLLADEVAELSGTVTTLGDTVGGVSSDVSTLTETATALTDGLAEVSGSVRHLGDNLSPFFEHARDSGEGRYWQQLDSPWTILQDGWARFEYDNDGLGGRAFVVRPAPIDQYRRASLVPGNRYTLLVETRSYEHSGEHAELYVQSKPDSYMPSPDLLAVWNGSGNDFHTEMRSGDGVRYCVEMFATDGESATETLLNLYVRVPQYSSASFEMRLSLFEGDYSGPWKPCVWWFRDSMADMISATVAAAVAEATASEDVRSDITINPELPVFTASARARRIGGVVFLSMTIQLNEQITINSREGTLVCTLTRKAFPDTFTYLTVSIPGVRAFVGIDKVTVYANGADVSVGVSDDFIISGSYLAQ